MTLTDLEKSERSIALFLGKSGHGKSAAIASYGELGPMLVIDIDKRARGMLPASQWLGHEVMKNITIEQDIDVTKGWSALDQRLEVALIQQKTNQFPYKTLVIESASTLQKMLLLDSQRLRGSEGKFDGKVRGKVKFLHPDDYNYASMAFNQLVYNCLLLLRCNLILSSWTVNAYGPDPSNAYGGNIIIGQKVLGTEKLAEEIPGYFDEVYLFAKEETGMSQQPLKYTVTFENNIAKTSNQKLRGKGKVDITGKSFYKVLQTLCSGS